MWIQLLLACSAFSHGGFIGKSYDWSDDRGHVVLNRRGVEKKALVLSPADKPATWTSAHASMTFNQYGRELPNGGINDAGLVVEVLMLPQSTFPAPDARPVVNELGLVQLLLDQATTVNEALSLAGNVRVAPAHAKVHYFVCEESGRCAAIEYLGGKMVTTEMTALTNSTCTDSKKALVAAKL